MREKKTFYLSRYESLQYYEVYDTRLAKLFQQLHLVFKMLFQVLVYLLKNWSVLLMIVIVKRIKILLISPDECCVE